MAGTNYAAQDATQPSLHPARSSFRASATTFALGLILALYACARILEVVPGAIPRTAIVALDVLSAMAFALIDGARHYRLRGILVFAFICIVIGNITENIGVVTGFPFGHYFFVELMGPKLFHVPVLLGLAYIGMAYVSWTLARLITGNPQAPLGGTRLVTLPLVASFVMVAWDLAEDPVWSTVLHGWIWRDGGPWFGVPVSNYLGWYGTVLLIYLLFALYLRRSPAAPVAAPRPNLRPALLFYILCALGNVLQAVPRPVHAVVEDPAGHPWRVADITAASALVSVFVMGGFAAVAWVRLAHQQKAPTD
ncbi:MAG: carotenoid biosynthesis protein [Terracidiphilus sp.]|jgi:putative membrane protein